MEIQRTTVGIASVALLMGVGVGVLLTLAVGGGGPKNETGGEIYATRQCGVIVSPNSNTTFRLSGTAPDCGALRRWAGTFVRRGSVPGWRCAASQAACSKGNRSFELTPAPEARNDAKTGRPRVGDTKKKLDAAWGPGTQVTCAGYYEYEAPEGPVVVEFKEKRVGSSTGCIGENAETAVARAIRPR